MLEFTLQYGWSQVWQVRCDTHHLRAPMMGIATHLSNPAAPPILRSYETCAGAPCQPFGIEPNNFLVYSCWGFR